ncbi:MAG: GIY-YIG nuclease family protein [Rhodospirillales bacterium]
MAGNPILTAMGGWVYIMANQRNGTLYVGVTADIRRRAWEHREALVDGFTKQYGLKRLVHVEWHDDIRDAIHREKRIKHWSRQQKLTLIEAGNPGWNDLYDTLG